MRIYAKSNFAIQFVFIIEELQALTKQVKLTKPEFVMTKQTTWEVKNFLEINSSEGIHVGNVIILLFITVYHDTLLSVQVYICFAQFLWLCCIY